MQSRPPARAVEAGKRAQGIGGSAALKEALRACCWPEPAQDCGGHQRLSGSGSSNNDGTCACQQQKSLTPQLLQESNLARASPSSLWPSAKDVKIVEVTATMLSVVKSAMLSNRGWTIHEFQMLHGLLHRRDAYPQGGGGGW